MLLRDFASAVYSDPENKICYLDKVLQTSLAVFHKSPHFDNETFLFQELPNEML